MEKFYIYQHCWAFAKKNKIMTVLYKSIETLYGNRRNFVVIALTGRTGAGCTTAAEMLTSTTIDKIKLPKPLPLNDNEGRK